MTIARRAFTAAVAAALMLPATAAAASPTVRVPGLPPAEVPLRDLIENPHPLLPSRSACPGALNGTASARSQQRTMVCLINKIRARRGLRRLKVSADLTDSARRKRLKLVRCKQFSHTPCGESLLVPFKRSGYTAGRACTVGENLAWGTRDKGLPLSIVNSWLKSPAHRANMLSSRWREQGLSMRWHAGWQGHPTAAVWVSHFGTCR